MAKGVLVDITKCVGCESCTVACKLWNQLQWDNAPANQEKKLSANNWTMVGKYDLKDKGGEVWRFAKHQCFHCEDPACVSACFAKALKKTANGPVVYNQTLCVGCRYCMLACPFDIPKYDWSKTFPTIQKCQMCATRIENNQEPACTEVCPTGALKFGDRDKLLQEAKQQIAADPKYIKTVYGEKEVGGTSWLYISDVPFEQIGFKSGVTSKALPPMTESIMKLTPAVIVGWGGLLTGMYIYTKRRNKIAEEEKNIKL